MKNSKIIIILFVTLSICMLFIFSKEIIASNGLNISGPSIIVEGQDLVFTLKYDDNVSFINISDGDVILNGFTASSKSVSGNGQVRTVRISNIKKTSSDYGSITINGGTGYIESVTKLQPTTSQTFKIKTNSQIVEESTRPVTNNNQVPSSNVQKPPSSQNNNSNYQKEQEELKKKQEEEQKRLEEERKKQEEEQKRLEEERKKQEEEQKRLEENEKRYNQIIPNPNTGKE